MNDNPITSAPLGPDGQPKQWTKEEILVRIQLAEQNGFAEVANKLKRDYKHLLAPEVPLGAQAVLSTYITQDVHMLEVKRKVGLASKVNDTILIIGPTGTGKELFAKALHADKDKSRFISVNCAGLPSNLIESELFGHSKGSFTGADKEKHGLFAQAEGGTILLDEIGELPLEVQAKLLRVLQEKEIRKVGSNIIESINVRIVCATHRDLRELITTKPAQFREDLYYRICMLSLTLTGLAHRPHDIPPLIDYWATKYEKDYNIPIDKHFPRDFMPDPVTLTGNVRSIQQIIRRYHVWKELPGR